ncbi:MAG: alpha/beta fold hydrolase [Colwellia sp.]|nr:alpha/beta fold hydrolase [Colwellia sp.]
MPDRKNFSQESKFKKHYQDVIEKWWQQVNLGEFTGVDNIRINYAYFTQKENKRGLVISPGRCESFLKYKELCYDFSRQGYNIYILDHRGQGTSQRILSNKHKGYVQHFDHYAQDLHTFISTVINSKKKQNVASKPPYLLAHSMGGAIAIRMLELYPKSVCAALLSSPMVAINSGRIPSWLTGFLVKSAQSINELMDKEFWYFFGQKDYQTTLFSENNLMQSEARYQQFIDLYQSQPEIQLGGVTIHWLNEAIKAEKAIFKSVSNLKTPIRILQAGNDTIVDNNAQRAFCKKLHQSKSQYCPDEKPVVINGARHELFFEQDQYRNKALNYCLEWFDQYDLH